MATKYTFYFTDGTKTEFSVYPYTTNGILSPTNGTFIPQAVSAKTTLKLYGKGMQDYGEGIQQNLIYMLENFSNSVRPLNSIEGQLWYNNVGYSGSPTIGPTGPQLYIRNTAADSFPATGWDAVILATGTSHMTGELILAGDPTESLGAVTKQYVDRHISDMGSPQIFHLTAAQNQFLDSFGSPQLLVDAIQALDGLAIGGSPFITVQDLFDAKVNKSGDTMTGTLIVSSGGSPLANIIVNGGDISINGGDINFVVSGNVNVNGGEVLGLPAVPSATGAASKEYVDALVFSAGADGVLQSVETVTGSPLTGSPVINVNENTLRFTVTNPFSGSPTIDTVIDIKGITRVGHNHNASEIVFDNFGSPTLSISGATVKDVIENIDIVKAPIVSPTFTGTTNINTMVVSGASTFTGQVNVLEPTLASNPATKNYVDTAISGISTTANVIVTRTFEALGSPSPIGSPALPYLTQTSIVGDNKLSVSINGIKQYAHSYAKQNILYTDSLGIVESATLTGLDQTKTYTFAVNIDGGGPVTISIPAGTDTTTHNTLTLAINSIMVFASPVLANAVFSIEGANGEAFTANTSGGTSSIAITDPGPIGSPESVYLFATDPTPTTIIGANFRSQSSITTGSPVGSPLTSIPDDIIISGDVTASFPAGKSFTIRGSAEAIYGSYDGGYRVHDIGPLFLGSPAVTLVPIASLANSNTNVPLLATYDPTASPAMTLPMTGSPANYGQVHFTPIVEFVQVAPAINGVEGDYAFVDSLGNTTIFGTESSYLLFNYSIPSGSLIETILIS